jgi:hypothetical protein
MPSPDDVGCAALVLLYEAELASVAGVLET